MHFIDETQDHFINTSAGGTQMLSMHYHSSYELYYLEAGSREYFVEDQFFSVSSGNFVLIPPYKFHRTGGDYGLRILVGFSSDFLAKTFTPKAIRNLLTCFDHVLVRLSESKQKECLALLKLLMKCSDETDFAVYLSALLLELSKSGSESIGQNQISELIEYINQNFAAIQSIEQIADAFYISKYHLCRIFKQSMGITLIDYLNHVKVRNACSYLEFSEKGILEVSQLCGFHSSAYFSNVFKKITSLSPSEYRKEKRHNLLVSQTSL